MKNTSAAMFLKHIFSVLCSMTKTKSMAIRDTTNVLKARLTVLSLLKNKKLSLRTIPAKIHAILGQQDRKRSGDEDEEEGSIDNAFIISSHNASEQSRSTHMDGHDRNYYSYYYNDSNDRVDPGHGPDLITPSLFEDDESDLGDPCGSVIDLVRNKKEAGGGGSGRDNDHQEEDFKLEDEINQVADLFILKFHKRMRLQKLESFKRFQEMLQRGT